MTLTPPPPTPQCPPPKILYLSLQLGCLAVNSAAHWSLSGKAAGVVCTVPYGFHSTQSSPFQWAVVELMWDTLRQSRPLGFGLSAVHCDALLWNSPAHAVFKKSCALLSPSQYFFFSLVYLPMQSKWQAFPSVWKTVLQYVKKKMLCQSF